MSMQRANTEDSRIIEFFGLPGSGKTTIAREVVKEFTSARMNVVDFNVYLTKGQPRVFDFLKGLLFLRRCHFRLFIIFLSFMNSQLPLNIIFFKKFLAFVRNYVVLVKLYEESSDCIVIDQGIIQAVVSIANNRRITDTDILSNLLAELANCFPSYLLIHVEIDDLTCQDRLLGRVGGTSTLDYASRDELHEVMSTHRENFCLVQLENASIKSITIDSKDSVSHNARIICSANSED